MSSLQCFATKVGSGNSNRDNKLTFRKINSKKPATELFKWAFQLIIITLCISVPDTFGLHLKFTLIIKLLFIFHEYILGKVCLVWFQERSLHPFCNLFRGRFCTMGSRKIPPWRTSADNSEIAHRKILMKCKNLDNIGNCYSFLIWFISYLYVHNIAIITKFSINLPCRHCGHILL